MSYIIGKPCEATCDTACVAVCPVDCIHGPIDIEGRGEEVKGMTIGPKDMLYINPDECIDCGACLPECPVEAIYEDEQEAIEKDGAEVLILGSTTMHQSHIYLSQRLPVPVINPGPLSYKMAEAALGLGLSQSRKAYPRPMHPRLDMLQDMMSAAKQSVNRT